MILRTVNVRRWLAKVVDRQQNQLESLLFPIKQLHPDAAKKLENGRGRRQETKRQIYKNLRLE